MSATAIPLRSIPARPAQDHEASLSALSFESLVAEMLRRLGEDPLREGLRKTPERVAKSMRDLTAGYHQSPAAVIGEAIFHEDVHDPVIVRDIEFYSLCEHHMLPFYGKLHIAYVPDGKIVGLSKLPRLVEVFSRRLQVQERLTAQVADAVMEALTPKGVAVVSQAHHMCMMMRGVETQHSTTISSAMRGVYQTDALLRTEVLRLTVESR